MFCCTGGSPHEGKCGPAETKPPPSKTVGVVVVSEGRHATCAHARIHDREMSALPTAGTARVNWSTTSRADGSRLCAAEHPVLGSDVPPGAGRRSAGHGWSCDPRVVRAW